MTNTPILYVEISEELNKRFRVTIIKEYGNKKGALRKAVTEALELWLKDKEGVGGEKA